MSHIEALIAIALTLVLIGWLADMCRRVNRNRRQPPGRHSLAHVPAPVRVVAISPPARYNRPYANRAAPHHWPVNQNDRY